MKLIFIKNKKDYKRALDFIGSIFELESPFYAPFIVEQANIIDAYERKKYPIPEVDENWKIVTELDLFKGVWIANDDSKIQYIIID